MIINGQPLIYWECLFALRMLRLRCNLHPIHGAIVEVVDGVYDGMEEQE